MIALTCVYSKKAGFAWLQFHQFAITLQTEITDLAQVQAESARLYKLLQEGVDTSIKEVGFLPTNGNGRGNGQGQGNGSNGKFSGPRQRCLELLRKAAESHPEDRHRKQPGQKRDRSVGPGTVRQRVKALNKLEASGLIEELLEKTGQSKGNGRSRYQNRFQQRAAR